MYQWYFRMEDIMKKRLYDLMDWAAIEAIVYSEEPHPENILGPHKVRGGYLIHCFLPDAQNVHIKIKESGKCFPMEQADDAGVFAAIVPGKKAEAYTIIAKYEDGSEIEVEDPYLYTNIIGESDTEKFNQGIYYDVYKCMGAHPVAIDGILDEAEVRWDVTPETDKKKKKNTVYGVHFAVWAPNAMRVSVVGDFNFWDGRRAQMCQIGDSGVYSLFIPNVQVGDIYKYEIKKNSIESFLKTDPYGFQAEKRPRTASVVACLEGYKWKDGAWLKNRAKKDFKHEPVNIYEVHLGSWKKKDYEGTESPKCEDEFLNYREIAPQLASYVKDMGYTHVELMPVMEHPLDESWGYQVTGYFAATSRYGSPEDFMYFVDYMHQQGIGVIIDWVPAHFPRDAYALARFDGSCLYENPDPRRGAHPHWGTLIFDYGKPQVDNFLISNALFWKDKYHIDGIRMDAVASMLYLDYGKQGGEWLPNIYGGNENLEAIELFKKLSTEFHKGNDGAVLIAEESTAWPKVTSDIDDGGLGFDLKWNMGWMNDFTSYMQTDPLFRKGRHGTLLFSMVYAYSENFILVFSHDEVVHLKCSMIMKMPGDMEHKFANLRTAYGFMMAHPGKKLLFMGQEFAQLEEWNEKISLPWHEADMPAHSTFKNYVKALNKFYSKHPALYQSDFDEEGFEWISTMDADHSVISFIRRTLDDSEILLFVCNFTPVVYENFKVGVPFAGKYKEIFNSDSEEFGGTGHVNRRQKNSKKISWDGREDSITIELPPLGMCVFNVIKGEK